MDKVAIFVDLGYLNHITSQLGNLRIDYNKLSNHFLSSEETHYRTYVYYCPPYQSNPPTDEEKLKKSKYDKFITVLKKMPRMEIRSGRLVKKSNTTFVQKRVDTYFAIDLVKLSLQKNIQKAILIAGDSDFVPAIKEAKEQGIMVKILYYPGTIHDELRECADEVEQLRLDTIKEILYNSSGQVNQ